MTTGSDLGPTYTKQLGKAAHEPLLRGHIPFYTDHIQGDKPEDIALLHILFNIMLRQAVVTPPTML